MRHFQIILLVLTFTLCGFTGVSAQNHLFKSENSQPSIETPQTESKVTVTKDVKKLLFSVAAVSLLFMVLLLLLKKFTPGDAPKLPKEVFEILGKSPLAFRQQLYLMRCGKKIFIVSLSQNGLDRVGEIEDPEEVNRLLHLCRGESSDPQTEYKKWNEKNADLENTQGENQ